MRSAEPRPGTLAPKRALHIHKLGEMLRCRFYIGMTNIKGKEYQGHHEPIAPRDLFDRVQEVLDIERGGASADAASGSTRNERAPRFPK